jgi:ABC-2 type transport system permease protein/lipopolysaccharide transport system permease protein
MQLAREIRSLFSRGYFHSALFVARVALREQYRNSYLGMGWALVQSIVYILTLSVVFSVLMRSPMKDYALFMMSGMLPWQFFTNAVTRGAGALANRRHIFHHTPLPKTMFVLADLLAQLYPFVIALLIAILLALLLEGPHLSMLALPLALAPLTATAFALAILFAYVSAYIWDMPHVLNIVFQTVIWTAPVIYPLSAVPERFRGWFAWNPIYLLIHPVQQVLYEGVFPSPFDWAAAGGIALLAILSAYVSYVRLRKNVIYYL